MKWQIALLACFALAQAEYNGPLTSFEPNKEYKFKYEAQILTGIKDAGKYVSALKLEAMCNLQIKPNFKAVAKLEQVGVLHMVDVLPEELSPFESLPREHFQSIDDHEIEEQIRSELIKPIKFTYKLGKVYDLETEEDEQYWSVNMKRGLLNVLELKLESTPEIDDEEPLNPEVYDAYHRNEIRQEEETPKMFDVKENGIEGKCKTTYVVKEIPENKKEIIKVKDLNKCENKPFYMTGILTNLKPKTYGSEEDIKPLLKVINKAEYVVKGEPRAFLILKALYKSQHFVAPFEVKRGVVACFTTQKIELMDVSDRLTVEEPSHPARKETWLMEFPKEIMSADPYSAQSSSMDVRQKKSKISEVLTTIVSHTRPHVSVEAVYKMIELIQLIKEVPKETVKQLITELESKKVEILIDLIPADDTPKAIKLIKELLLEGKIGDVRASIMITANTLVAPPSPEIIDTLMTLCKTEYTCSKPLENVVLLSIGTIAGKIYKMKDVLPVELVRSSLSNVEYEFKSVLSSATKVEEKVMIIKAMANAGLPAFLPELEKLIKEPSEHLVVKGNAIIYLTNYTSIAPRQIQKIVMPIYLDVNAPHSLRIVSLIALLETNPTLSQLSAITSSLLEEPNHKVGGFAFTYLSGIAKTKCTLETAKRVKLALLLAKPVAPKFMGSSAIITEVIEEKSHIGLLSEIMISKIEETVLPSVWGLRSRFVLDKTLTELFEGVVQIDFRGLKLVERALIGEEGILWQIVKNQITPKTAIKRIIRFVKEGELETASEEAQKLSVHLRLLATEIFHIDITTADINTIYQKVQTQLSTLLPKLMSGWNFDLIKPLLTLHTSYMIPTPVGMPVSLNGTLMSLAGIYGNVQVSGVMSTERKIVITNDIKTSSASIMKLDLGVHLPMLVAGHALIGEVETKLPNEAVTEIDLNKMTLTSEIETPKTEIDLVKAEVKPVAYIIKLPVESEHDILITENKVKPEIATPEYFTKEESEIFGLGVKAEIKKMTPVMEDLQLLPMWMGKHSFKFVLKPGTTRPNKMEFKLALLCPMCPLTESEKHEFIFDTESVEEERSSGSWWSPWSSSSRRRISSDVAFDTVVPDTHYVDPSLKYKLAAILKTKESSNEKIIAAQVCALTDHNVKKVQLDTQWIVPSLFEENQLVKAKVITKALIPQYLYEPSVKLRESDKVLVHKTEVFIGDVSNPSKKLTVETKLMCLECEIGDLPKEYTPVKLETKFIENVEISPIVKEIVKKVFVLVKKIENKIFNNIFEIEDLLKLEFLNESLDSIKIETLVIPTQLKAIINIKVDKELLKVKVCPYELPWSVPQLHSIYISDSAEEDIEFTDEPCSRRSLTKKIRRTNDLGDSEICFSIEPVHMCKGSCRRPDQYHREVVPFTCKPRYAAETRRLVSESLSRPLYDLAYEPHHLVQEVAIPVFCDAI